MQTSPTAGPLGEWGGGKAEDTGKTSSAVIMPAQCLGRDRRRDGEPPLAQPPIGEVRAGRSDDPAGGPGALRLGRAGRIMGPKAHQGFIWSQS